MGKGPETPDNIQDHPITATAGLREKENSLADQARRIIGKMTKSEYVAFQRELTFVSLWYRIGNTVAWEHMMETIGLPENITIQQTAEDHLQRSNYILRSPLFEASRDVYAEKTNQKRASIPPDYAPWFGYDQTQIRDIKSSIRTIFSAVMTPRSAPLDSFVKEEVKEAYLKLDTYGLRGNFVASTDMNPSCDLFLAFFEHYGPNP